MFRTLLLLLAGSTLMAQPLSAQDCCADKTSAEKAVCADCSAETASASDLAKGLFSLKGKMWACDIDLDFDDGSEGVLKGKLQMAFADTKHFSLSANMDMSNEMMGEGSMEMVVIADGKEIYLQQEGMGQPAQVLKIQMSLFEKLLGDENGMLSDMGEASQAMAFLGIGSDGPGLNPSAIDTAFAAMGAKIVDAEEGVIRLLMVNPDDEADEFKKMTMDFDAKSFFPQKMTVEMMTSGDKPGGMNLSIENVVFHEKLEGFGEKAFSFTPPEGMFVMDLTPMIEMQLQAAGGGVGDEEELEF